MPLYEIGRRSLTVSKDYVESARSAFDVEKLLRPLDPKLRRQSGKSADDGGILDLSNVSAVDDLPQLDHGRISASLQANNSSQSIGLGQLHHLLCFRSGMTQRPLDKDLLLLLQSGEGKFEVVGYDDADDDEVDIGVVGQVLGVTVGFGGFWEVVELDGATGGFGCDVAEGHYGVLGRFLKGREERC